MSIIKRVGDKVEIYQEKDSTSPIVLQGLGPKHLLEASVALCTRGVIAQMFERDGIEYSEEDLYVEVEAMKSKGSPAYYEKCILKVTLPEHLSASYKKKILVSAERGCTIGNTLKKGLEIVMETES